MMNVVLFFGVKNVNGEFSNHYVCEFKVNGNTYNSVEQYMMAQKALIFRDFEIFNKIMNSKNPVDMKHLGREVRGFNAQKWNDVREKVVKTAVKAKFTQNEDLKKKLMKTGDKILAECNPKDSVWGIGLGRNYKEEVWVNGEVKKLNVTDVMDKWGENKLGKILMEVRKELKEMKND